MAPSASSIEEVSYIYRTWYSPRRLINQAERDHPRFKRLKKRGGFGGESMKYHIRYGNPQGIGKSYAGAKRNATGSKGKKPEAFRFTKRAVLTLDGESIDASMTEEGAAAELVRNETTGMIDGLGEAFAFDAYRDGTGLRGKVLNIVGDTVFLETAGDARNFPEGMTVIADNNADGETPIAGSGVIIGQDIDNNSITFDDITTFTGVLAIGHYLFRDDDPGSNMEGLMVCTPLVAPVLGSDDFRGIDRGRNPQLLAGCRVTGASQTVEDAIMSAAVACGANKKRQTTYYINPIPFHNMTRRANAQVVYDKSSKLEQGFETAMVTTAYGTVEVVADPDCPLTYGWGVNEDEEEILYLGKGLPFIVAGQGGQLLFDSDNDGLEVRFRGGCNYFQYVPGCFSIITFSS